MRDDLETVLVCAECGKESEGGARCWRPLLTVDDELATYCPDCAREDFGDARLRAARRLRQPRDPASPQACPARAAGPRRTPPRRSRLLSACVTASEPNVWRRSWKRRGRSAARDCASL